MQMFLRAEFPNGPFGDPALYIWDIRGKGAFLFDCGDLTRFTTRQLLKVSHLFLSHCHVDHFYGFDQLLRIHMGFEKEIEIFGPPETSLRVGGKLAGYSWNLIHDQSLGFAVTDLDFHGRTATTVRFHSKDRFQASDRSVRELDAGGPLLDWGVYKVMATELDHHIPSLAYRIEEKPTVTISIVDLDRMGLATGPWINTLKSLYLFGGIENESIEVPGVYGTKRTFRAIDLADEVLLPQQRQKLAYVTDGAANEGNRAKLLSLLSEVDLLFSETCFMERDRRQAEATRHFTARFIAELARDARVRRIAPFHFSKRYLDVSADVYHELQAYFPGEILRLEAAHRCLTL